MSNIAIGSGDLANVQSAPPLPIIKIGRSLKEGLAYFFDWLSAADLNLRGSRFVSRPAKPADITERRSREGQSCPRYHLYIQMILLALALQGLAGEQPYTFPRKSQLSNQPGIL